MYNRIYNSLDHCLMLPRKTHSGQNGNTSSWSTCTDIVHTWPLLKPITKSLFCHFVLTNTWHCLQLLRSVFTERFPRKWQIIGFSKSPQIKVVLGIYTGGNVDIELQHFQKLTLKFIPVKAIQNEDKMKGSKVMSPMQWKVSFRVDKEVTNVMYYVQYKYPHTNTLYASAHNSCSQISMACIQCVIFI